MTLPAGSPHRPTRVGRFVPPPRAPRSLSPGKRSPRRSSVVPWILGSAALAGAAWWIWQQPVGMKPASAPAEPPAPPAQVAASGPAPSAEEASPEGSFTIELPDRLPDTPPIPQAWALGTSSAATVVTVSREDAETEPEEREDEATSSPVTQAAEAVEFPPLLELVSPAANHSEEVKRRELALQQAIAQRAWDGYRQLLTRSLVAAVQRLSAEIRTGDLNALLTQPLLREALVRRTLLEKLPKAADHLFLSDDDLRSFVEALFTDPTMGESFLISLVPENNPGRVLTRWADLWEGDREGRERFRELALACALVYEKPADVRWNGQTVRITAEDRYAWYKKNAEAGRLTAKIDRMPARDLAWVVSAPVPESELDWALKKMSLRQRNWGAAYTMVAYDMERAVKGTNSYDAYTFEEILKKGGICGDRAYFACNTARAHGIPAAYISGDGSRGPHAWFRWRDADGVWHEAGRFDGYALGNTTHPQTGRSMSEEIFVWRSEGRTAEEGPMRAAAQRLWLADVLEAAGDYIRAVQVYNLAVKANPRYPEAVAARLRFWLRHGVDSPLEEWTELVRAVKQDFRADPGLMALAREAEEKVIFPRQEGKAVMAELRRDTRRMDKEASQHGVAPRDEEIALTYARQAEVLKKNADYNGIHALYRKALNERSNAATFKHLARDYYRFTADNDEAAARACRQLENAWKRHVDAGGDYFDIDSQNQALAEVIECYRKTGNEAKVKSLQRELERRQNRAERKAL